jgi:predicted nucleic acid-binding Zn ribbon protein
MGQNTHCVQCGKDLPKEKWTEVPSIMTIFQMLGHKELHCSDKCYEKFQKEWCV